MKMQYKALHTDFIHLMNNTNVSRFRIRKNSGSDRDSINMFLRSLLHINFINKNSY